MDFGRLIRQTFDYRTSRIIATCRVVFSLLFVVFLTMDPSQPARSNAFGVMLLACYVGLSFVLLAIAWRNWWLDYWLARPAMGLDVFVFLTAVFFTENTLGNFVSPFMSFFAFLMLSSISRWGWKAAAWTALVILFAFLLVGLDLHQMGFSIDLTRFSRRIAYMMVLSLVLVWFGSQNFGPRVPRFLAPDQALPFLIEDALAFAVQTLGASQGAFAWSDDEEPRAIVKTFGLPAEHQSYYPAESVSLAQPARVTMFEAARARTLVLGGEGRVIARAKSPAPDLAQIVGIDEGLSIPLEGSTGTGQILLSGIPGMTVDHMHVGLEMGREIALAMDRHQLAKVTSEAAMMRLRSSIARDLHDSLAQSLAGANFRLQGLRGLIASGADPIPEIGAIQAGLSGEQAHVRQMIQRLRQEEIAPGERDLTYELKAMVSQLERKWGIKVRFADHDQPLPVPALLVFEVQQLIREGVANAVRHGHASAIEIGLSRSRHEVVLTISDNGVGFAAEEPATAPRSLAERIGELGGTMVISSREKNTRITMTLPIRGRT